jgi:hypothetical protein
MAVLITKADGTTEPFNPQKLVASLVRANAEHGVAQDIVRDIEHELYSRITTQEIYRHAFAKLRDSRRGAAARYSLKRAILELGPSGFPFEAYLAELFKTEGYKTAIDQVVQGACVPHEVDVVMRKARNKDKTTTFVEAKFHNAAGFRTDLKTVLYVKARLDDIGAQRKAKGIEEPMHGLIVTNTKFTAMAAQYAACAGVELLSWEEPLGKTLQDRIEAAKLFPVTALTTLNRREKLALIGKKVVLCSAISGDTRALAGAGLTGHRADQVLEEVGSLCAA